MAIWIMAVVAVAPCQRFSPDHIVRPDLLNRLALALDPADAGRKSAQCLTQPTRVPCGPPGQAQCFLPVSTMRSITASTFAAITSLPPSFAMKLAAAHQPAGNVSGLQK
jgi:hypothetical protein